MKNLLERVRFEKLDKFIHNEAIQYEKLTQEIYSAVLKEEGVNHIEVEHNITLEGRSGVEHQIDVFWRFKQAGIEHAVLIECKNYATSLTLEKIRNFFGVLHDIGNAQGIIVTKTGYQSGAAKFAKYYGIKLKILRKPIMEDWHGRIKNIHMHLDFKTLSQIKGKEPSLKFSISVRKKEEEQQLNKLLESGQINSYLSQESYFSNENYEKVSDEIKKWFPLQLKILDKEEGGPYTETISLEDKYIIINEGQSDELFVRVDQLEVTYYVDIFSSKSVSYGEQIVDAILRDFDTNDVEFVKRNNEKL